MTTLVKTVKENELYTRTARGTVEIEKREDGKESRIIEGYGIVWDKWSVDLGWFKEKVNRNALEGVDLTDVVLTLNHTFNNLLGRTSAGTVTLTQDDTGLKYRAEMPNTSAGNDTLVHIGLRNIIGSSFMFTTKEVQWTYRDDDELDERIIMKLRSLIELGPVTHPAYTDTTAEKKQLDLFEKRKLDFLNDERAAQVTIEDLKLRHKYLMAK